MSPGRAVEQYQFIVSILNAAQTGIIPPDRSELHGDVIDLLDNIFSLTIPILWNDFKEGCDDTGTDDDRPSTVSTVFRGKPLLISRSVAVRYGIVEVAAACGL